MTEPEPLQLAVAGLFCGILATWLLGICVYLRWLRHARAASRRVLRFNLESGSNDAAGRLARDLKRYPLYETRVSGLADDAMSVSLKRRRGWLGGARACNLDCRFERIRGRFRLTARMDFNPLAERTSHYLSVVLLLIWPLWITAVGAFWILTSSTPQADPMGALHLAHAVYPLAGIFMIQHLHAGVRRDMEDVLTHHLVVACSTPTALVENDELSWADMN
jgi:hypothetical protein